MKSKFEEKTLKEKTIYKGKILDLKKIDVLMPNARKAVREIIDHCLSVCALLITRENKIVLVGQYRKAVEEYLWEIPAGLVEKGEDPKKAIAIELFEEVGSKVTKIKKLVQFYPTPGFCNESLILYNAKEIKREFQHTEDDENIKIIEVSINEALSMINNGSIHDSKSIIAILHYRVFGNNY